MSNNVMKPKKDDKEAGTKPVPKATQRKVKDMYEVAEETKERTDKRIEKERDRLVDQMKDLIQELERLKRENDKLRRQQEQNMGVTADTVDEMRKRIDHAKATNNFLINDIEDRKNQVNRLETQSFEMTIKVESITKKLQELQKVNENLKIEVEELTRGKVISERLWEENRRLRRFLASNRIDHQTGKPIVEMHKDKRLAGVRKKVTIKITQKDESQDATNKRLIVKHSKSMDDLRKLEEYYDRRSARSVGEDHKITYGQYTDILKKRRSMQKKNSLK